MFVVVVVAAFLVALVVMVLYVLFVIGVAGAGLVVTVLVNRPLLLLRLCRVPLSSACCLLGLWLVGWLVGWVGRGLASALWGPTLLPLMAFGPAG